MGNTFYKDVPDSTPEKAKKFWCPNGRRPNLVVLCSLRHDQIGAEPTDYTYDGKEVITTVNCCLEKCPWLAEHPEFRPKK